MLLLVCATSARADTTGTLTGFVKTAAGYPVSGVLVTASSAGTIAAARTDATGFFSFISLPPESYVIRARKYGYDEAALLDVSVHSGLTSLVVLIMKPSPKEIAHITDRTAFSLVDSYRAMLESRLNRGNYPMFYDGSAFGNMPLLQQVPGVYVGYGALLMR